MHTYDHLSYSMEMIHLHTNSFESKSNNVSNYLLIFLIAFLIVVHDFWLSNKSKSPPTLGSRVESYQQTTCKVDYNITKINYKK